MTETVKEDVREQLLSRILLRRFAEPAELAGVVALLASNAGSFITGQTMVVDGGQSIG
jgi:gluconate 5-dehydrogenase